MNRQGEVISQVPIDWWPGEVQLSTIVERARSDRAKNKALVRGVSLYRDFYLASSEWVSKGFDDFVFGAMLNGPQPGDTMAFLWAPPITPDDETADHPEQLVDEEWKSQDYSWPNVMLSAAVVLAPRFAGGGDLNDEAIDRKLWLDGMTLPTLTRIRTYASNERPPKSKLRTNRPMPTAVESDYKGVPVRVPPCLHPEVTVEPLLADNSTYIDITLDNPLPRTGATIVYPATNHLTWQPHVSDNDWTLDGAIYKRVEVYRVPPRAPLPALQQ